MPGTISYRQSPSRSRDIVYQGLGPCDAIMLLVRQPKTDAKLDGASPSVSQKCNREPRPDTASHTTNASRWSGFPLEAAVKRRFLNRVATASIESSEDRISRVADIAEAIQGGSTSTSFR